ncbi:hypothetical protein E2C01_076752 [Portunus trituberculatus]|uniref:Uncharacterized protein n=1 Tax=Portunus trituberculatus TaxID=210409 RepID=A0A5B7IKH1_PORTR|nr:hypothetical protein [Portunus trituberculatus]
MHQHYYELVRRGEAGLGGWEGLIGSGGVWSGRHVTRRDRSTGHWRKNKSKRGKVKKERKGKSKVNANIPLRWTLAEKNLHGDQSEGQFATSQRLSTHKLLHHSIPSPPTPTRPCHACHAHHRPAHITQRLEVTHVAVTGLAKMRTKRYPSTQSEWPQPAALRGTARHLAHLTLSAAPSATRRPPPSPLVTPAGETSECEMSV